MHRNDRVRQHSPEHVNRQIAARTAEKVRSIGASPPAIEHRLGELDREWDIERTLFAVTSVNLLIGLTLTATSRRWLPYPMLVAAFQLQHAVQGWCPPLSVLRRMGVRTRQEIESERVALRSLRGDFRTATATSLDPDQALELGSRQD